MKTIILTLFLVLTLSYIAQANAGDNDDNSNTRPQAQFSERDPFQLPATVKQKGLTNELNKLAPAAGPDDEQF